MTEKQALLLLELTSTLNREQLLDLGSYILCLAIYPNRMERLKNDIPRIKRMIREANRPDIK